MNIKKRILSMILAAATVFSSVALLASCDNKENENTEKENVSQDTVSSESATQVEEAMPDIEKKNYGDQFYLHVLPDVNVPKYYFADESKGDILTDAIYTRQEQVYQHIGVEIIGAQTGNFKEYLEPFKTSVKNKDGAYDTLISHVATGIDGLISENYLTDFNNIPGVDLDAEYWNQQFMEDISIADRMYLGFSDFNILYTHVVTFNKTLLERYDDNFDESIYDMVTNYHWTLDKLFSIASMAYIDKTNDGKSEDDQFGISAYQHISFVGFLHSSNINLVEMDKNGNYVVSVYNDTNREKTAALVDMLDTMVGADYSWFRAPGNGKTEVGMKTGRALFNLSSTYSLPGLIEYDVSFGVLPYPMWDENQKDVGYRSLQWGGYICVPSYTRNIQMVGETLELLSFYSADVTDVFYQKLLGKQVADSPQDKQMLDIVWDGVCSDFGQTYSSVVGSTNLLYMIPELTYESSTQNIASFMAKVDRTANKLFKQFVHKVSKMQ